MKVYIVRAKEGIGIIYGVFESREDAERYSADAAVAIEGYEVVRPQNRTLWGAEMNADVEAIRRMYAEGNDTFLATVTCRQDVRFLLDRLAAAERVVEAVRVYIGDPNDPAFIVPKSERAMWEALVAYDETEKAYSSEQAVDGRGNGPGHYHGDEFHSRPRKPGGFVSRRDKGEGSSDLNSGKGDD